jgi:hypothetical protein
VPSPILVRVESSSCAVRGADITDHCGAGD